MFNYDESISAEKEIAASAEKIWNILALAGGLTLYHPYMKEHTAERWNGVGSKDHVTYYSGLECDREVLKWIEGTGYDLRVTENGKHELTVIFRITPINDQRCKLSVTINADFIGKLPFPVRWALLKFKMKPVFISYLHDVQRGLAYYAETGQQVKRNQFGTHPIMSP